jgi:glycosyltransferase involved in cell wall biosynthesis
MKRNLVHVITTIERGGAELAILELSKIQVQKGNEITVIPLKGRLELLDKFESYGVSVNISIINKSFFQQIIYLRKNYHCADYLHAHLPRAELAVRLSSKSRPFNVTRHNQEKFFTKGQAWMSKLMSRFVTKKASHVISISQAVQDFILQSGEISSKSSHTVIPYGYVPRIHLSKTVKVATLQSGHKIRIGTIGRLVPQKNFSFLLDFAFLLKSKDIDFNLEVIGEGPEHEKLLGRVKQFELSSSVKFLGRTLNVEPFLLSQDVFIFTSKYEGLGLVLLEAMDANLPIIAPSVSAIPEVLGTNHPGLYESENLDSLYQTFTKLLSSRKEIQDTILLQRERLSHFGVDRYYILHSHLYD